MKYLSRLLCVAILIWAIFSFSSRPVPKALERESPPPAAQEEKISLKSSAPLRKIKKNRVQILSEWIQEDRLCDGKGNYLRKNELKESTQVYQALELACGNARPDPCLSALLSTEKKQILRYASMGDHESCRFLRALVLTDQLGLEGKASAKEAEEGRSILKELASLDPDNGVFPFFLLGSTKDKKYLRDFLLSREFRDPLTRLAPRLREIGFTNATSLLYSIEALATMKVPNYQAALKEAREGVADPALKSEYLTWLKNHLMNLEEIRRLQLGEPFVWTIEIAVLRSVATTGWKAHGEGPKHALLDQKEWKELFRQLTNMEAFEPFFVNEDQPCERIQEAVTALLPDFAAHSESMARRWAQYR